ncbi:pyrroline-5-carboxylate reductase 3 [Plodia interpunctella]|uniref:pyrroline-5-carboxylate reductase 3 n=1 Tax=Plodia interpunctella TaxID=58824 RepID=UPI00236820DB|nr:pyrroline-5-carboxylate reductase 3 [Plodia interpunctella]
MFNLGFIGGGNMSTAIAKGILNDNAHPASNIWVSGPRLNNLKHWSEFGAHTTTKNGEILANCDVVFLGVKPGLLNTAVEECISYLHGATTKPVLFISMLAGVTLDQLHKALQSLNVNVIRIMPNTPMMVGAGACLYTPDTSVTEEQCLLLEKLLKGCGLCEKVPENLLDSLGSLTACGPAFMYIVIEALADGAVKQGVPRETATRLAAQTAAGGGRMVLGAGRHPAVLKDEVCSPGGSTICGVAVLERGKIRATLIDAIEASTLRNKELGKK